jgi:hypothetical protein
LPNAQKETRRYTFHAGLLKLRGGIALHFLRFLGLCAITCGVVFAQSGSPEATSNRWFSLDHASLGARLAASGDSSGSPMRGALQHQEMFEGAFLFDAKAKYSVHANVADGDGFTGGWANSGAGRAPGSYNLFLKQLYVSAKPVSGIEFQYGGIGVENGFASGITSYAGDGYFTGGRILVHRPASLFFDTIGYTKAYLGDLETSNLFRRFHHVGDSNYQQFLVAKNLSKRVSASLDYTNQWGAKTMRESAHVTLGETHVFDAVQLDFYQRTNGDRKKGFHVGLEKAITSRVSLVGGYAAIDQNYGDLNDDAFFHGKRAYLGGTVRVTKSFSVFSLYNRATGNDYAIPNRTHFHVGFNYDLLHAIAKTGMFNARRS